MDISKTIREQSFSGKLSILDRDLKKEYMTIKETKRKMFQKDLRDYEEDRVCKLDKWHQEKSEKKVTLSAGSEIDRSDSEEEIISMISARCNPYKSSLSLPNTSNSTHFLE
ncbi:UNVERIFIED_CONTAM: hypothetical protein K2H54_002174 [Gekko kuhli]